MLTKRIIPCLDVKEGKVVKGVRFREHQIIGDIEEIARRYVDEGADELVFYDITASSDQRTVDSRWVVQLNQFLNIPFCVAGGIRTIDAAKQILHSGADKISINSPALENPDMITEFSNVFGSQCVVVGVDSYQDGDDYMVYQYTGDPDKMKSTQLRTLDWVKRVEELGAGEIVLNCMNQDGMRQGYDIEQLAKVKNRVNIPVIASGGAGEMEHFKWVFQRANVDGALAAKVFHSQKINIPELKRYLKNNKIHMRV